MIHGRTRDLELAAAAEANVSGPQYKHDSVYVPLTSTFSARMNLNWNKTPTPTGAEEYCSAMITVPLSAYPSVRLAARPADMADAIREKLDDWNVSKCSVTVWIDNDTGDELASEDTCLREEFRYDGDSVWSAGSETSCYDEYHGC